MPNARPTWFPDEHPRHEVTFTNAFYVSAHEVTQASFEAVIKPKKNKKETAGQPDEFRGGYLPAVYVSWQDAQKFCQGLNRLKPEAGRTYSLPTEAQWEYACRAGSTTPFSFGETVSTDEVNYHGDYIYHDGVKGTHRGGPVPAGSLRANAWGLHEMHGNVSEWCADWYGPYDGAPAVNPTGPAEAPRDKKRVVRGGAWRSYPGACRSACRLRAAINKKADHIGFRVCCTLSAEVE